MAGIVAGVEPVPQPSTRLNPGGDCFACVVAAVVNHLCPDHAITIEQAFGLFAETTTTGTPTTGNTWVGMQKALQRARYEHDVPIVCRTDIIQPRFDPAMWAHDWFHSEDATDFTERLEAWLSAGWVAIASYLFDGTGPYDGDLMGRSTDHFVLLDGARAAWEDRGEGCSVLQHSVHVVCSVRGARWQTTRDLLRHHGVAGLILVRRDNR